MTSTAFDLLGGANEQAAAITMDVFDTAVTRCWAQPRHVFLACAPRLRALGLTTQSDEAWMQQRQQAEARANQRLGPDMATLADICEELARETGWSHADQATAGRVELEAELSSVRAVPSTLAFCEQVRQKGLPLRFLSDMYLPEVEVTRLLRQAGYGVAAEQVWVSSHRRASKSQGALFSMALAAWQHLMASQILHAGDNIESDVRHARRSGLQAVQIDEARLPAHAKHLLDVGDAPLQLRSLVSGAIRAARLQSGRRSSADDGLWQLGSGHAGPMLTLYVWWLLMHAERNGIDRLYFLARDGQVLLEIARILQAAGVGARIELCYLHASRQAWFAPSVTRWDEATLIRLLDEPDRLNDPAKLARRLGFDSSEAMSAKWPQLIHALVPDLNNRDLANVLVRHVAEEVALAHTAGLRDQTLAYLEAEGLFDGTAWAIVDLGWRGRMQECLARIVQSHPRGDDISVAGYYFGLIESPRLLPAGGQAWAFSSEASGARLPAPAHLLELFCEADHGSTQGYAKDAQGNVRPVFDPQLSGAMRSWGLPIYRQAVLCYTKELASAMHFLDQASVTPRALLALTHALGREFFSRAEPSAACAFARMPCSHSVNHDEVSDLAPTLVSADSWCRALSLGRLRLSSRQTGWLPGSLARSDEAAYRAYLLIHHNVDRLRRRINRMRGFKICALP